MPSAPDPATPVLSKGDAPPARSRRRLFLSSKRAGPTGTRPEAEPRRLHAYLASILSGVAISIAWWFPETSASALLGWIAAFLLVFAARTGRGYLPAYCCGLACCSLGFYWIYGTLSAFGGFGTIPAALLFALFVTLSALQFWLFAFIHHHLGPGYEAFALRSPTALVLSELLSIRLFHWHYGHTQLAFTPFVQVAGIGGAMLVSFLMFWLAEVAVRVLVFQERRRAFLLPVIAFGLALHYGGAMIRTFSPSPGAKQDVVLVQGNVPLADRGDLDSTRRAIDRLHQLSRRSARGNPLVVWPEGSIPAFIPATVGSVREEPILPGSIGGAAFLVGSYSEDPGADKRYNAAFAIHPDGRVPPPYFKQILIPFGEYTPFSSVFPWLGTMNARAGIFTAGSEVKVFEFPMRRQDGTTYTLKVSPLICYEDTVPALAREATLQGAELLVNLTYDTWFGRTAAPYEHHLIAAFRAIENRRFLVRVTNTGLSAVVDPLGRTIAQLPLFSEGTLRTRVGLLQYKSSYSNFVRERPWWILFAVSLAVIVGRWSRRTRARGLFRPSSPPRG